MSDQGSISSHDGSRDLPRPRFFGLRISEKEEPSSGRMRGRVLSFSFLVVMASRPQGDNLVRRWRDDRSQYPRPAFKRAALLVGAIVMIVVPAGYISPHMPE